MDTTVPYQTNEPSGKLPLSQRINLRVIVFAAVILGLVGWPIYTFVKQALTHGIEDYGSYKKVDLKAMGNFLIDNYATATLNDVPKQYRELDGQKIELAGEIYAPNETGQRLHEFELVYSIQRCCVNGPPLAQERVFARVPNVKGLPLPDGSGYARVTGTLHVTMHREAGQVTKVYEMDVDKIERM